MVFIIIEICIYISFFNFLLYFVVQCTPSCKKFLANQNKPTIYTNGNLFGAHNKRVAKDITVIKPSTCTMLQPEIIQPAETVRTKKEEEIAKGNVFTKKDNHPTFEDIKDDWEPSMEDIKENNPANNKKWIFRPPKPEQSYTNLPSTFNRLESTKTERKKQEVEKKKQEDDKKKKEDDKKKQEDDKKKQELEKNEASKDLIKKISERPHPSRFARTLREEEIAQGKRKYVPGKEERTFEDIQDDWDDTTTVKTITAG
uniref:Uncharacterized protein n=1 Tax=Parastrongyloides trichosuri TaxID=131310 RepID=A0A0N4Z794_PARTI